MKPRIREIALQAGGSTYPEVGGEILEKFADLLIKDFIQTVDDANMNHCCGTTYDLSVAQCAREKILKHLQAEYEVTYRSGKNLL
jgi:hypothetical protein